MRRNRTPRLFWQLSGLFLAVIVLSAAGIAWLRAQPRAPETAAVVLPTAALSTVATLPPATAEQSTATHTPAATPTPTPLPSPTPVVVQEYVIQEDDNLIGIADRFGVTVEALMEWNGLENAHLIQAGATLQIPPPLPEEAGTGAPLPSPPPLEATSSPLPVGEATGTPSPTAEETGAPLMVGVSAGGRPIEHYVFGDGPADVVFVGAIHGGYEWNTANLAYGIIDYFARNPGEVPDAVTLHVIPVANPDGMHRVSPGWTTGPIPPPTGVISDTFSGRFNDRDVDLNRNFDCNWAPAGAWRDQQVSGGTSAFSESETSALRDFFLAEGVRAVVFWHSAAGAVLPGRCEPAAVHQASLALAEVYAAASEYPVQASLVYEITGDASDWLTTEDIPSFAVELTNHTAMEWDRNLAGTLAVLDHYATLCAGGACELESDR